MYQHRHVFKFQYIFLGVGGMGRALPAGTPELCSGGSAHAAVLKCIFPQKRQAEKKWKMKPKSAPMEGVPKGSQNGPPNPPKVPPRSAPDPFFAKTADLHETPLFTMYNPHLALPGSSTFSTFAYKSLPKPFRRDGRKTKLQTITHRYQTCRKRYLKR